MVELRQGRILTLVGVLLISCSVVVESDDNTTVKPSNGSCSCELKTILLYVESGIIILAIIGGAICLPIYRHWGTRDPIPGHTPSTLAEGYLTEDLIPGHTPSTLAEDSLEEGRISNVELWELVVYSAESKERDKLLDAIRQLTPGTGIPITGYGTCSTDYERKLQDFQSLCSWKMTCAGTEQMEKLFEACSQVEMGKTVKKLKDFRYDVSEGVSKYDLKHILWQIGKKSSKHITTLLDRLPKSPFNPESNVPKYVDRAYHELQIWTKGKHAINPAVMLSLQSDDLCDEDMYFCTVSEEDKRPLKPVDIKQHVRNVSRAHCNQIISISSTKGKSNRKTEEKSINTILDENETDLFNTYQMIKEWLDEQECSNYEKRMTLQNAVEGAQKTSKSNEISLGEIELLASGKENAEVAYELLMKDIKPFAVNLRLDESKLAKYKQLSSSPQSMRGTIGLVAGVRPKKGKKGL